LKFRWNRVIEKVSWQDSKPTALYYSAWLWTYSELILTRIDIVVMILLTFLGTEVIVIIGNDELRGKLVSESLWHIIIIDAANILCCGDVVGTFESWF